MISNLIDRKFDTCQKATLGRKAALKDCGITYDDDRTEFPS